MTARRKSGGSLFQLEGVRKREEYAHRIRKYEKILILIMLLSFVVFIVIAAVAIFNEGVSAFVSNVESINLFYYFISFLIVFAGYAMRFPKWEMYIRNLGVKIDRTKNFMIYLSMYSMDVTPGRWGRAIVSYTINKLTKVKFSKTFPAVVADIFTDFAGFVVVTVGAAFLVSQYVLVSIGASLLLLIPFIFLYSRTAYNLFRDRLRTHRFFEKLFEVGDRYFKHNKLLGKKAYAYSMLYTIPAMILNGLSLYFVMLAFGVNVGVGYIPTVVFVLSLATMLGMVSGIPANIGVTDATLIGFLVTFFGGMGVTLGLASVITIFTRLVTIWFVQLFGFASLAYTLKYWQA
ncbi:MAG: flippase-like domain-containing protein [Candidatus Micrarchaeota archaeon]|nr:flippase-like domain-containing protein [Candidatus Micrarchaeota archaeon]